MTDPGEALRVLERMTRILDAFDDEGLPISELARRAELPKSTVSRLVATLVAQRYLERDGRLIHLGLRVFELGQLARAPHDLRAAARPVMHRLRDATRYDVHVVIRDEREAICVAVLRGPGGSDTRLMVGERVARDATAPAEASFAGGRVVHAADPAFGGWCAAQAFLDPGGEVVGAISVSAGTSDGREELATTHLREAATALTARLAAAFPR